MASKQKVTFRKITEDTRIDAAEAAWSRARLISRLRHQQRDAQNHRSARQLSKLKANAVRLALSLAPEQISVTIDNDYQIGLLSVRWPGHGKLHLPASTQLT